MLLYICTTFIGAAARTNILNVPGQHHTKESSIGYSISSDFQHLTKWDVVYLTSSTLAFDSGTHKP